jgi:TRAP-type C4-dicarboxylate transport system permease small subunit
METVGASTRYVPKVHTVSARRLFFALLILVCLAGFIHDAYTWASDNHKSFIDVLGHYWYVVVYAVAYAAGVAVRFLRSRE